MIDLTKLTLVNKMTQEQTKEIKNLKKELEEKKKEVKSAHKLALAAQKFESETKKQVVTALVAAFAFLIALVWKDVITKYTNDIVAFFSFPGPESIALVYTAVLTTIIAVTGIILVNVWGKKDEPRKN